MLLKKAYNPTVASYMVHEREITTLYTKTGSTETTVHNT